MLGERAACEDRALATVDDSDATNSSLKPLR
jgi:hypothetical protein